MNKLGILIGVGLIFTLILGIALQEARWMKPKDIDTTVHTNISATE